MLDSGYKLRLGNVAGHQVFLDVVGFGLFALFVITGADPSEGLQWPISFLVGASFSILVHELGHAAAVRQLNGEHCAIVLGFLGGYTLYQRHGTPRAQVAISLAGPFAGFVLGAVGWAVAVKFAGASGWPPWGFWPGESVWLMTLYWIIKASLLWGALNLVPCYPLDGGQTLRWALISFGMAPASARRFTRRLAVGILVAVAIWVLKSDQNRFLLFIAVWAFFVNADEARSEGW